MFDLTQQLLNDRLGHDSAITSVEGLVHQRKLYDELMSLSLTSTLKAMDFRCNFKAITGAGKLICIKERDTTKICNFCIRLSMHSI